MAGFLYFLPGARTPDEAEAAAREAGLAHLFGNGAVLSKVAPSMGPSGTGSLLVPNPPAPGAAARAGFDNSMQEWRQAPGQSWWLGFEKDRPPGPEDLARERQIPGYRVELGDGRRWLVPVARRYVESGGWRCALARRREIGPDGQWCMGPVVPGRARLWEWAERLQEFFEKGADAEIDGQEEANRTVEVLAANYSLGPVEVSVLGLLTDDAVVAVADALLDGPGLEDLRKKAEAPGGVTTSPGGEG